MRRSGMLFFVLVLGCVLCACGSGSGNNSATVSRFAGTFDGTWVDIGNGQQGTLTTTVSNSGTITGTLANTTRGTNAVLSGTISEAGATSITLAYPTTSNLYTGVLSLDARSHIVGSIQTTNGVSVVGTSQLDLTKR
ncbi:MAG: hypothetical protein NT023_21980 [Armatimonadetes bacterium]|nr:hypothetical protein [Armatimonadota bacterium]